MHLREPTRRGLLTEAAVLGVALTVGGQSPWARAAVAYEFITEVNVNRALVERIESAVRGLASQSSSADTSKTLGLLNGLASLIYALRDRSSLLYRDDLTFLSGLTEALRGLVASQMGQRKEARAYLHYAQQEAIEIGASDLLALVYILRCDIYSAVQQGKSGASHPHILEVMGKAVRLADDAATGPALRTYARLRMAEERAAMGDAPGAMNELEQAHQAWAKAQAGVADLWGMSWTTGLTSAMTANTYVLLGDVPNVADGATLLHEVVDAGLGTVSDRIAALTDLASAMARLKEPGEAARLLETAHNLARQSGRKDRADRIGGVVERDLTPYQAEPSVRRLRELLAS